MKKSLFFTMAALQLALFGAAILVCFGMMEGERIWQAVAILGAVELLLLWCTYLVARLMIAPLDEIRTRLKEYSQGDFSKKIHVTKPKQLSQMAESINDFTRSQSQISERLAEDKIKLEAIVESITSGLIAIDKKGRIVLANLAAQKLLGIREDPSGQPFEDVVENEQLRQYLKEAIRSGQKERLELTLQRKDKQPKILRIGASRMKRNGRTVGCVAVLEDITELTRLENIRTEFAANVSHEMKTPLTSIRGFAETLLAGVNDEEQSQRFLHIITSEADRLTRLINDILYLSELESGTEGEENANVNLTDCAHKVYEIMNVEAEQKGLVFNLVIRQEDLFTQGDEDRVSQMLINLLSNAIKYTPSGGRVDFEVDGDGNHVYLAIRDTGIGIPKEAIPRLSERFYRVDKGRSRAMGGTGLGLAIVKHILVGMKGKLKIESEEGKGSCFTVILHRSW